VSASHTHDRADHHDHGGSDKRALGIVLALTAAFVAAEVVGAFVTGSLALLADAGHMLSDAASLAVALFAVWLAGKPATPNRSFGFKRAEILAALFNGVSLVAISFWIFFEAVRRFSEPPEVLGGLMLAVAALGLLVNVAGVAILSRGRGPGESLNVEGAMRHVFADALGSIGAIGASVVILLTGWRYADPLASVLIGALILLSSWRLLRDSVGILLEETPRGIDAEEVGRAMVALPGVEEVHDLHVWTITSGFPALAAHVLVGPGQNCHAKRRDLETLLKGRFGIGHTTLQVDHAGDHAAENTRLQFLPRQARPR
jgi:cobalt-zinc-cadmium efflux system protein